MLRLIAFKIEGNNNRPPNYENNMFLYVYSQNRCLPTLLILA